MKEPTYSQHWIFALASALGQLEKLIWEFDSIMTEVDTKGEAAYAGVPEPNTLINIVEGFLTEKNKLFTGDIARLERMHTYLTDNLVPIYELGRKSAEHKWKDANSEERHKMADFDFPVFRNEARMAAPQPVSATEKAWFVEGFSKMWREMWVEYHRAMYQGMNPCRHYIYVGPQSILELSLQPTQRACIRRSQDVLDWMKTANPSLQPDKTLIVTFIVDTNQKLWIADRHSEHVVCAKGQDVLSAGEMTFAIHGTQLEVVEVTNQSTGYCPEPESWWAVEAALSQLDLRYPSAFTTEFLFRRCEKCGTTNIVKDHWFECAVCGTALSLDWNYSSHPEDLDT